MISLMNLVLSQQGCSAVVKRVFVVAFLIMYSDGL